MLGSRRHYVGVLWVISKALFFVRSIEKSAIKDVFLFWKKIDRNKKPKIEKEEEANDEEGKYRSNCETWKNPRIDDTDDYAINHLIGRQNGS